MGKKSPIVEAIKIVCEEKGLSLQMVVETVEAALAAAYRKDFGEQNQNIKVTFDLANGTFRVYDVKEVVEDPELEDDELEGLEEEKNIEAKDAKEKKVEKDEKNEKNNQDENNKKLEEDEESKKKRFNPKTQIAISEAQKLKSKHQIGDIIKTELEQHDSFGRMAAQTAKQVITQKLREAERVTVHTEFKDKEGEILIGVVQRREGRRYLIDLGKVIAVLPYEQQVPGERLVSGQRVKVFMLSVEMGQKGPEVIVTRSHPNFVKKLFELEIPEITDNIIEIKSIAREAGSRTKIAVLAHQDDIDPIGSCVGQRGTRVQTVINEINNEKIDIILYSDDPNVYIANALSPAKISDIEIDEANKNALVTVAEDQLSLAIGKAGQNVRLAAKLTGWKINIKGYENGENSNTEDKKIDDKAEEIDENKETEEVEVKE